MTREEAIKLLVNATYSDEWQGNEDLTTAHNMAIQALSQEPTDTQKSGKWIRVTDKAGHLVWECDKCGWQQRLSNNFCPDCGAKMVEPQESEEQTDAT